MRSERRQLRADDFYISRQPAIRRAPFNITQKLYAERVQPIQFRIPIRAIQHRLTRGKFIVRTLHCQPLNAFFELLIVGIKQFYFFVSTEIICDLIVAAIVIRQISPHRRVIFIERLGDFLLTLNRFDHRLALDRAVIRQKFYPIRTVKQIFHPLDILKQIRRRNIFERRLPLSIQFIERPVAVGINKRKKQIPSIRLIIAGPIKNVLQIPIGNFILKARRKTAPMIGLITRAIPVEKILSPLIIGQRIRRRIEIGIAIFDRIVKCIDPLHILQRQIGTHRQ